MNLLRYLQIYTPNHKDFREWSQIMLHVFLHANFSWSQDTGHVNYDHCQTSLHTKNSLNSFDFDTIISIH